MQRHIIYIINPVSGTGTKRNLRSFVEAATTERGISYTVFPSVASGDYSFLLPIIKELKATDIVIAGGDGTVNQVVNALMHLDVNFGILPLGSGNGLAFAAKIPKQTSKALDIVFAGKASPVDAFSINDHFSCMLCGLGFDAKVAHDFAQQPKRGLRTYITEIIRSFFSAKPYSFELQMPDHAFKVNAYFISIANSNQFGNHFTIAPKASLDDGLLDIVILTDQNKLSFLLQTLKQVRGKNPLEVGSTAISKKRVIYFQTDQLRILNKSLAPLHIDGDPAETAGRFEIKTRKHCFRLLQPLKM